MLYDPRWQKIETQADPFSLDALIAWLEKQPAGRIYCYFSNGECLLSQYFTESGFQNVYMFTHCFWSHATTRLRSGWGEDELLASGAAIMLPSRFDDIAGRYPHTFGAALSRARAIKDSANVL